MHKHPNSGFVQIIIILVIILAITGAAGFYVFKQQNPNIAVKPTPSPVLQKLNTTPITNSTGTLTIYENKKFGYSIMYDKKLNSLMEYDSIEAQVPSSEEQYWTTSISLCPQDDLAACGIAPASVGVSIYQNPKKLGLSEWITTSKHKPMNFGLLTECINYDSRTKLSNSNFLGFESKNYEFIIDTITAKLVKEGKCKAPFLEGGGTFSDIILERGQQIFFINLHYFNDTEKQQLEKILSTFQFTN